MPTLFAEPSKHTYYTYDELFHEDPFSSPPWTPSPYACLAANYHLRVLKHVLCDVFSMQG